MFSIVSYHLRFKMHMKLSKLLPGHLRTKAVSKISEADSANFIKDRSLGGTIVKDIITISYC